MTTRQRMPARDYKNAGRSQPLIDLAKYKQFGSGLAVGLVLALFVWIYDHRGSPSDDAEIAGPDTLVEDPVEALEVAAADDAPEYLYPEMLPNFEVSVPDRSINAPRNPPARPVEIPGAYVLQVGAYQNVDGAGLQRDRLAKLDIEASILHVSDETSQWHIVRVGPIRDLDRLNAMQKTLRAADIEVMVQRVGD